MFRHGANQRRNTTNDVAGLVEPTYVNNTSFEIHLVTKNLQSVRADDRWNDFVSELEALDYDVVFWDLHIPKLLQTNETYSFSCIFFTSELFAF